MFTKAVFTKALASLVSAFLIFGGILAVSAAAQDGGLPPLPPLPGGEDWAEAMPAQTTTDGSSTDGYVPGDGATADDAGATGGDDSGATAGDDAGATDGTGGDSSATAGDGTAPDTTDGTDSDDSAATAGDDAGATDSADDSSTTGGGDAGATDSATSTTGSTGTTDPPPGVTPRNDLPTTGSSSLSLAQLALGLVAIGGFLVLGARRR